MAFKHILVATDFSDASGAALDLCRELARDHDSRVTLVHAYPENFYAAYPVPAAPLSPSKEQLTAIKRGIEEALERLRGEHLDGVPFVAVQLLTGDDPSRAICDHAREQGADLIVVGSHGRSGLSKLLLGSVAGRVVQQAHCPVLVSRASE
ncbi:MAG: universal stress protein [Myxococcales bacterium]|nr:universal stress protein [Myxococcales bacterium]